jgi:type III secretion protein T
MNASVIPPEVSQAVFAMAIATPRMLVALALLPYFSSQSMTRLMLSGVTGILAIPLIPSVVAQLPEHIDSGWLLLTIVKESAVGLIIGFACGIPFWAAAAMGFLIDNQRGAALADNLMPGTGEMATPLSLLFSQAFNILFLIAGGMGMFLMLMYESYLAWPVVGWVPTFNDAFAVHFLNMVDSLLRIAVMYASPAIVAMLLGELALAFVSLFAPQLQVFFLAMPIKSGIAMFILLIYLYTLADLMSDEAGLFANILPSLRSVIQ